MTVKWMKTKAHADDMQTNTVAYMCRHCLQSMFNCNHTRHTNTQTRRHRGMVMQTFTVVCSRSELVAVTTETLE